MDTNLVVQIGRELIFTGILLVLPTVAVSLVVGLVISLFQTVTSIQEQTLTFAPRILAVGGILVATLPWSLQVLSSFTFRMMWLMSEASQ